MIQAILTVEEITKEVLEAFPETRSNDKELLIRVWEKQGLYLTPEQQYIFKTNCNPSESITRARRDIQHDGLKLQAIERVKQQRLKNENKVHDHFSQKKAEPIPVYDNNGRLVSYTY